MKSVFLRILDSLSFLLLRTADTPVMMYLTWYERVLFALLFLLNKYVGVARTERWLCRFERHVLRKYIAKRPPTTATPIPTLDADKLTDVAFLRASNHYRRPVVIRGMMKDSRAVKRWNLPYLATILGDFQVNPVGFDANGKFNMEAMSFRQFVARIEEPRYINNNHTILNHAPKLFGDVEVQYEKLVGTLKSTNLRNIHIANLFIGVNAEGKRTTGSNIHAGGSGNFFCQVKGRKHWTLIDPRYSAFLKGRVARSGIHAQSLFDGPDVPLDTVPDIIKRLPRYEVWLEEGDVLWNAPWWWHRIVNDSGLSIGMAIRNNKVTWLNLQNNPTYTLSGWIYLLYNSAVLNLYERFVIRDKKKHFGASHEEKKKDNVLYQIEDLIKRYPNSTTLQAVLSL